MKNKGFTLIELLAVIVILGIIALVTVPNFIGVLNSSIEGLSKEQIIELENAARAWGLKNVYVDGTTPSPGSVTIKKLKDDGFLENKTISLKSMGDTAGFCIKYEDNQFIYDYNDDINNCTQHESN